MDTNVLRHPIRPVIDDVLRDPINGSGGAPATPYLLTLGGLALTLGGLELTLEP